MLYTIGHSNISEGDFLSTLGNKGVVDVRSHPTSMHPQFRRENMQRWLHEAGRKYVWIKELGGWDVEHASWKPFMAERGVNLDPYLKGSFPKGHIAKTGEAAPADQKPIWTSVGLRDYSWYMYLPEFKRGAEELKRLAEESDVAYMCCECLWFCCHRSMIADYMWKVYGLDSIHLQPAYRQRNKVKYVSGVKEIPHSTVISNRLERYDEEIVRSW